MQEGVIVRPGHFENTVSQIAVVIFVDQAEAFFPVSRDAGDVIDHDRFVRFQNKLAAQDRDRIEDGTLAVGQGFPAGQCCRSGHGIHPAEEFAPVGFIGNVFCLFVMNDHHGKRERRFFRFEARATRTDDRVEFRHDFRLDEQFGKSWMGQVGNRGGDDRFRIAGQLDGTAFCRTVRDLVTPEFDIVFWRNDNFTVGFDAVFDTAILGTSFGEYRFVPGAFFFDWLVSGRPEIPVVQIAQIEECSPVILCGIRFPAGDGEVFPVAVPATGVGCHDVVGTVGKKLDFRNSGVGRRVNTGRQFGRNRRHLGFGQIRRSFVVTLY